MTAIQNGRSLSPDLGLAAGAHDDWDLKTLVMEGLAVLELERVGREGLVAARAREALLVVELAVHVESRSGSKSKRSQSISHIPHEESALYRISTRHLEHEGTRLAWQTAHTASPLSDVLVKVQDAQFQLPIVMEDLETGDGLRQSIAQWQSAACGKKREMDNSDRLLNLALRTLLTI